MTTQITSDAAGTVRLGGLGVPRLGSGAMRLPGPGVWGPPTDEDNVAAASLRLDLDDLADLAAS